MTNTMGISMGPFVSGNAETFYHFSVCQDGFNINAWGPPVLPIDAGPNFMFGGFHQGEEQMSVLSGGQAGGVIPANMQLSTKGKDPVKEGSTRKERKHTTSDKGKVKVIATGHKNSPKKIWIKRGSLVMEGEQKSAKKLRIQEAEDDDKKEETQQAKEQSREAGGMGVVADAET